MADIFSLGMIARNLFDIYPDERYKFYIDFVNLIV
jgi:hypothetical protein